MPRTHPPAPTPLAAEQDPRWADVVSRNAGADSHFVYAVKTTGVYCRPGSASRLPRPENIEFFSSAEAAEAAGYRPSLRQSSDRGRVAASHATLVAQACRLIEQAEVPPGLAELARQAGLSPAHFHRVFKGTTGLTPKGYAEAHRACRLRESLATRKPSVTAALFEAGFGSNGRFYGSADKVLGMKPLDYREGGRHNQIRFAIGQCSLGAILVAQSSRGVCAILMGDDPDRLARELQDTFPRADLVGADAGFESLVAQVVGFVESPRLGLDLPLDVRGTAFQERVWRALREIPAGTTATYAEIAARIGAPTSARAVAQACGANRIAVAIPCHRVVASNGKLSGYRWGVERKQGLLDKEKGDGAPTSYMDAPGLPSFQAVKM